MRPRPFVSVVLMLAAAGAVAVLAGQAGRTREAKPQSRGGRMTGRMRAFCPSRKCRCYHDDRTSPNVRMVCASAGNVPRFTANATTMPHLQLTAEAASSKSRSLQQTIEQRTNINATSSAAAAESSSAKQLLPAHALRVTMLSLHNVSRIRNGAFAELPYLQVIDLSQNEALGERAIGRHAFLGVEATLERLALSSCGLQVVPTDSMTSLHNLRHLCLEYNGITTLHANAFRGLGQLNVLHLYANHLVTIETKAFHGLNALRRLLLYDNDLTTIGRNTFSGLANLRSLDLANNDIVSLDGAAFRGLTKLRDLNLDDNSLFELSRDTLADVRQLTHLSLRANPLTSLGDLALRPLLHLQHLVLPYVGDAPMTSSTFAGLRRLDKLHLDEVRGASLADGAFSSLPRLQRLFFSNYSGRFDALHLTVLTSRVDVAALDVVVTPLGDCSCSHPWILALVRQGARVGGQCTGQRGLRPVSCARKSPRFTPDDFTPPPPPLASLQWTERQGPLSSELSAAPAEEEKVKQKRRRPWSS